MKRVMAILSAFILLGGLAVLFTGCDSGSDDPQVKAYDEWYIRTHDIFGNPR
ncbi:hypothetical protein [Ruminococcus sp.]|uniref:hypothetical protein n=1 Tax=Ruminococcus sp. TaxID=41978 RepID=UPI0025E3DC43|nr:hypothetical protein [Ruminococcus sp.]